MSYPNDWQNIAEDLTPQGIAKLKKGQVLVFDYEGSRNEYRIVRIKDGEVWVKPVTLMSMDEAQAKMSDEGLEPHETKDITDEEQLKL
jgi:hypothetical protein